MTLDEITAIDTQDPAAVKAVQAQLRSLGYYSGPLDGKWGGATTAAVSALRADADKRQAAALEGERLKTQQIQAENDPAARWSKMGTQLGPWAAGVSGGALASYGMGKRGVAADLLQKEQVGRLAANTAIRPEAAVSQLNELNRGRRVQQGLNFLAPAALFGGAALTRDVIAPQFADEGTRDWIKLAGTAENAAGFTLGAGQIGQLATNWKSPNDPEAVAAIRSRAMPPEPPNTPPPPPPPPPVSHAERALAAAKAGGATGIKTKAEALEWLAKPGNITRANRAAVVAELGEEAAANMPRALNRLRTAGKYALPLAAAGLAYDAASSDAEAAGLTPMEARGRGAAAAGIAGGTTAAAGYGLSKLPPAVGQFFGRAASAGPAVDFPAVAQGLGVSEESVQQGTWLDEMRAQKQGAASGAAGGEPAPRWGANRAAGQVMAGGGGTAMPAGVSPATQAAIQQLLAVIQEHNDEITPPPGRNPAVAYEAGQ